MQIKYLDKRALIDIYNKYLVNDFPIEETKPLELLLKHYDNNELIVIGAYDNEIVGYAILIKCDDIYLLDYFAIVQKWRNKGLGKMFLSLLMDKYKNELLFLECEVNDDNDDIKQMRIDFYLNNGLYDNKIKVELYDVLFHIFSNTNDMIFERVDMMYHKIYRGVYDEKLKYY